MFRRAVALNRSVRNRSLARLFGRITRILRRRTVANDPVLLLTRPDCGLCAQALPHVVRAFGRDGVTLIDITQHRDLEDQYVFRIPVVLYADQVLAEGIIGAHDARVARVRRDAIQAQRRRS